MSSKAKSFVSANRLLAALPAKDFGRWFDGCERVEMKLRNPLSERDKSIDHVYFPESGMISLVQALADGTAIEVGLIGKEGFFGVPLLLGAKSSMLEAMVQGEGSALRMTAAAFTTACREEGVRTLFLRYAQALHAQVTQTAVCNGRHPLQERLARWLLEAQDRFDKQELRLSHEFLSLMLGSRRAGVTLALGAFREVGLIATERACVRILDRKGVEEAACECYGVVRSQYRRLLS